MRMKNKWQASGLGLAMAVALTVTGMVPTTMSDVRAANSDPMALDGWNLYFADEFNDNSLDMSKWSYNTGYFLDPSDPNTSGWGNNEAEYYTSDSDNTFIKNGSLHIVAKHDPNTFTCNDAAKTKVTADYSSGKIISKDKVSFTYGRVDFRAKLPTGKGIWPALWMLPNKDTYGTWAASGEIDVMEARGRVTNSVCGTIHYGGQWPNNEYTSSDYVFPNQSTYDDGYHVYSVIWEKDSISWYVDGNKYQTIPKSKWHSAGSNSDTAPFDQDFYLIMNLAVGGNFDGGELPVSNFKSAEMLVDYVRVYKKGDSSGKKKENPSKPVKQEDSESSTKQKSDDYGVQHNSNGTLTFYVKAKDTKVAPIVYWGANIEDPKLNKLGGYILSKDKSLGTNYYSYTTKRTFTESESVSYLFGYTPIDGSGRIDSTLVTADLSDLKQPAKEDKPAGEYGLKHNTDGSVTFYVNAEETSLAPMVYIGLNKNKPALSDLSGSVMVKSGTKYYTYTTPYKVESGSKVSYLIGYTPVGKSGRKDTDIKTETMK